MLGLAGGGVYRAAAVTNDAVRSYRTFSTLPVPRKAIGGVFSVALSRGSPRVVVSHHRCPALLGLSSGCLAIRRPSNPLYKYCITIDELDKLHFRNDVNSRNQQITT